MPVSHHQGSTSGHTASSPVTGWKPKVEAPSRNVVHNVVWARIRVWVDVPIVLIVCGPQLVGGRVPVKACR